MGLRLAVLLAGCLALPALALAADTDPVKRITPADQHKAASIVLERADLVGGWTKVVGVPDDTSDLHCPGFDPDLSDLTVTGEALSIFKRVTGIQSLHSGTSVYRTRADAQAYWSRIVKPAVTRCLAHTLKHGMSEENGRVTILSQGPLAFPKVAPRTAAYRVAVSVSVVQDDQKVTLPFTLHWVGLGRGRATSAFIALGVGEGLRVESLRAYAKLLAGRLTAAKL